MTTERTPSMTVDEEQSVLYQKLRESILNDGTNAPLQQVLLATLDVMCLAALGTDNRELIKTLTAVHYTKHSIPFVKDIHDVLSERGFASTCALITEDFLGTAQYIRMTSDERLRIEGDSFFKIGKIAGDMISYAATSTDHQLVAQIISEHVPDTLEQLKEIHATYVASAPALRDGII
jgi:hypothetical protein